MAAPASIHATALLDQLRTELADLAFVLERQGRRDAADVVMQIDGRVCELAEAAEPGRPVTTAAAPMFHVSVP